MGRLLEATCDKRASGPGRRPRRGRCSGAPWAAACRPRADPTGSPAAAPASPSSSYPTSSTHHQHLFPPEFKEQKKIVRFTSTTHPPTNPQITATQERDRTGSQSDLVSYPCAPRAIPRRDDGCFGWPCSQQSSPGRRGNGKKTRLNGLYSYLAHIDFFLAR